MIYIRGQMLDYTVTFDKDFQVRETNYVIYVRIQMLDFNFTFDKDICCESGSVLIRIKLKGRIRIRIKVIRIRIRINLQMTSQNVWNMECGS